MYAFKMESLAVLAKPTYWRSRKMNFLYFTKNFKDMHYPTIKKVCNRLCTGLLKYNFFVKKVILIFFFLWSIVRLISLCFSAI